MKVFSNPIFETKKRAVFGEIKKMQPGQILTKEEMKEYIQALHDYDRFLSSNYVLERIDKFSFFELKELDLDKIETAWENIEEMTDSQKFWLKQKVKRFRDEFNKTLWIPPIIFDPLSNSLIDGNHRALALKELGIRKVLSFEGIKVHEV